MYEVLDITPKELFLAYVIFMVSCGVTFPMVQLIYGLVTKGVSRWR
jgi:hypothetical protein